MKYLLKCIFGGKIKYLAQENTYKNGKLDGAQKYWYLNGNMQSINRYKRWYFKWLLYKI